MSSERATRRGLAATAVLLAALVCAPVAGAASPENRAAAQKHFNQAQALKKQGQLLEACRHLEEVERLDPKLPTLIELAECSEQAGKLVEAQAQWALARDRARHDEKPQSRARAESRLAAVEKRVAHLMLQLAPNAPAGTQVLRDDVPLESASLAGALPTNPGEHVIVVKLAGHDDAKYAIKLADGDHQSLPIAPGPVSGAAPAAAAAPAAPGVAPLPSLAPSAPSAAVAAPTAPAVAPPAGWWTGPHTAGVILGAAGIVAIGGGSALCVIGNNDAKSRGSKVDSRLAGGFISVASGSVLLVTALVLFASAPSDEAPQHAGLSVTPTVFVGSTGTVLGAVGEF
jgi:hypothetical protein